MLFKIYKLKQLYRNLHSKEIKSYLNSRNEMIDIVMFPHRPKEMRRLEFFVRDRLHDIGHLNQAP